MKSQSESGSISLIDMERLARIFTWLTAGLLVFMLGMIFMSAIDGSLVNQTGTTNSTINTGTTNPY